VILVASRTFGILDSEAVSLVGLAEVLVGSITAYDWLGEKPDYSRTSYVSKSETGGLVIPYKEPKEKRKEKPEDQKAAETVKSRVDLIGVAILFHGFLLTITSAFL